jgi:hypothetical protein
VAKKPVGHWRARANDYWALTKAARDDGVRQVLEHLALVCDDMANALEGTEEQRKPPLWISASNLSREATAHRWRTRAAKYLAQADTCQAIDGIQGWRTLASRCAETAAYLEAMQPRRQMQRAG